MCQACVNFYKNHKFRLTKEDRETLNANPGCQICGTADDLNIDHDHATNKVRGYLCAKHNKGLGLFDDNIEYLKKAVNYLSTNV